MRLQDPSDEQVAAAKAMGYRLAKVSADGLWCIGVKPVIYGARAIAWRQDSVGPAADYCAADSISVLLQLLAMLEAIFTQHLEEQASENAVMALLPSWERRPVDQDPACWRRLEELAGLNIP